MLLKRGNVDKLVFSRDEAVSLFSAVIIYLMTLFFVEYYAEIVIVAVLLGVIAIKRKGCLTFPNIFYWLVAFYCFLAVLYVVNSGGSFNLLTSNPLFGVLLVLITILASNIVNKRVVAWLIFFLCLESVCIGFQFLTETPYFFETQNVSGKEIFFSEGGGLYKNKVLGLGVSSAQFSAKAVFILFLALKFKVRIQFFLVFLIFLGVAATFSRAGFVAFLMVAFGCIYSGLNCRFKYALSALFLALLLVFLFLAGFIFVDFLNVNFLKGRGLVELFENPDLILTGRFYLWKDGWLFWLDNILFGNFGEAYKVYWHDRLFHVHNSFLYLLTKGGIGLFVIYVCMLRSVFRGVPVISVLGFLLYLFFGSSLGSYSSFYELLLFSMVRVDDKY